MKPSPVVLDEPEEGSRVRVGAVLGGVLVVLAVAGLAWRASDGPAPPTPKSPPPQVAQLRNVWTAIPAASAPEPTATPASAPVVLPPGYIDVCGIGVVKESEWNGPARIEALSRSLELLRQRVTAGLTSAGDEASLAAALALQSFGGYDAVKRPEPCTDGNCSGDAEDLKTIQAAWKQRMAATSDPRDRLARLALGTRDPEVYALAYGLCSTHGRDDVNSTCRMLSAQQWARLDPGNGVPWLAVSEEAKLRGDRAAAAEALYRVSIATSMDSHSLRLSRRFVQQLAKAQPTLESHELLAQALSMQFAALSGYFAVTDECSAAAVRDVNRLQQCAALAETLWSRGTSFMDANIALALGKRVGWAAERLQAGRDEIDALTQSGASISGPQSLSCDAIARQQHYLGRMGELGELGAMREHMKASGRPLAYWLGESRKAREALVRSADAAPSAPRVR